MSRNHALKFQPSTSQQPHRDSHAVYTTAQVCDVLGLKRSTFYVLLRTGRLPFLEELKPRLGKVARYRADLVNRYLSGQWTRQRTF